MIFNVDNENLNQTESYKERNLYYKIFAGYLFNELIPGKDQRTTDFLHLLADTLNITERFRGDKDHILGIINAINSQPVHVTFDYHSAQVIKAHKKDDRGEMSDVLLLTESHFISVECKFLEDMEFKKDVRAVQERIREVSAKLKRIPLQALLMTERKWNNSKTRNNKKDSFYMKFQKENVDIPVVVLFWDEVASLITDEKVKNYLKRQIERKKIKD